MDCQCCCIKARFHFPSGSNGRRRSRRCGAPCSRLAVRGAETEVLQPPVALPPWQQLQPENVLIFVNPSKTAILSDGKCRYKFRPRKRSGDWHRSRGRTATTQTSAECR